MGNAGRMVDEEAQDRILSTPSKFRINQFITLPFNNFINEPLYPVPLDSHAHNNKKVGETPTQRFFLSIGFHPD